MYLFVLIGGGVVCWYVTNNGESSGNFIYWVAWLGIFFCAFGSVALIWKLFHAGEVMIRVSSEGVWIKEGRNGTTILWKLIDDVVRPSGQQKQFLVLKMTDENYKRLNRGPIHAALFHLNKLLGIQGIPLNIAGSTVSNEMFESWVLRYWNDWKERQVELGLKGKRNG